MIYDFVYGRNWTSRIGVPVLVGLLCAFVGLKDPTRYFYSDFLICAGIFGVYKEFMDWLREIDQ